MAVYYNEHDRFAAAWLRELIRDGLIPAGHVDERDIQTVQPADLAGYDQCHFFAGIGGWPYALRLAEWGDRPVWTGSCPCQPFSQAGKQEGFADPRHLWPTWFRLIRECRPPVVFGEQVGGPDGYYWLDLVSTDLEAEGYAFGAADLAAASVGAPHLRQRLFFVAHSESGGCGVGGEACRPGDGRHAHSSIKSGSVADAQSRRSEVGRHRPGASAAVLGSEDCGKSPRFMADAGYGSGSRDRLDLGGTPCRAFIAARQRERLRPDAGTGDPLGVAQGDTKFNGLEGHAGDGSDGVRPPRQVSESHRPVGASGIPVSCAVGVPHGAGRETRDSQSVRTAPWAEQPTATGAWDDCIWLPCRDGKWRPAPVEPALQPLAHGIPNRVGTLRGAGNAIVAPLAAEFIRAYLEGSVTAPHAGEGE